MAVWGPANPAEEDARGSTVLHSLAPSPAGVAASFAAMGARRLLVVGGIALIAGGMLFGDVFAVFVLHQNGGETGARLIEAAQAAAAGDPAGVEAVFSQIGGLLEDHGTKVDAHVHMTGAGYLALLLALVQPYVALSAGSKKFLAKLFLWGSVLLPIGIFLIHYIGLAYSPFAVIGWASVLADTAGALLTVVLLAEAWGLWAYFRSRRANPVEPELPPDRTWERRALLAGGTALVLVGFAHGAWYAGVHLYEHESRETTILNAMLDSAAASDTSRIRQSADDFGRLQAEKAVNIAAHSHIIEFGFLAMLLSFVQPYVFLRGGQRAFWVKVLLAGSLILPVGVFLEQKFGLVAGGIADVGGLLVIMALVAMLVGVVRYTGYLDAQSGGAT
ncbi:MAG TPA: hypothetical protein VKB77_16870 [Terriglobales bacterium]|nr:hypothetical protein [Terriglobales bacterium]